MKLFHNLFDGVWVGGQRVSNMENLTYEQLVKIDQEIDKDYEADKAAVRRFMQRLQRNGSLVPHLEESKDISTPVVAKSVYHATYIAVSRTTRKFTTREIFQVVQTLYTRKPVTIAAVNTALTRLKAEKRIKVKDASAGARAGTYIKAI